jgi:hypothetical protein
MLLLAIVVVTGDEGGSDNGDDVGGFCRHLFGVTDVFGLTPDSSERVLK